MTIIKNLQLRKNKSIFFLVIIFSYCLANSIMFFNNGYFWDDWTLYNMSDFAIDQQFYENGNPQIGELHKFLLSFNNSKFIYNVLTFFSQIGSAYFVWKILSLIKINKNLIFLILLLFTLIPFFSAKNTIICFPYTISTLFFYSGIYFMYKAILEKRIICRIISILLIFIAFTINSLIIFYILPVLVIYFYVNDLELNFKRIFYSLINFKSYFKIIDFILLPFVFAVFKISFFPLKGMYAEATYNEINLQRIISTPTKIFLTINHSFFKLYEEIINHVILDKFLLFLTIILIIGFSYYLKRIKTSIDSKKINLLIVLGLITFILGCLAYNLVGKIPTFDRYESRHQLLLPLGVSFIILGLIFKFVKKNYRHYIISLCISFFLTTTFAQNLQFLKGYYKQICFMKKIKQNTKVKASKTIMLVNKAKSIDASGRDYSFYHLNGILKALFKSEDRLFFEVKEYNKIKKRLEVFMTSADMHNMKDYKNKQIDLLLKIDDGSYKLNTLNTLKLIGYQYFNKDYYEKMIDQILVIKSSNNFNEEVFHFYNHDVNP